MIFLVLLLMSAFPYVQFVRSVTHKSSDPDFNDIPLGVCEQEDN